MPASVGNIEATLLAKTNKFKKDIKSSTKVVSGLTAALSTLAIGAAIKKVTSLAAEQERQETRLAAAITASGNAIDINKIKAYASELQNLTKFGDEETLGMAAMLTSFGANEDALISLLPKIQDMATLTGQAGESISQVMGRALAGNASMLSRYGIELSDAEQKVFRFGTQQERVAVLSEKLTDRFGGAAQAMQGTLGFAMAQASNASGDLLEDIGELVGQALIPLLELVTDAASAFTTWYDSLDTGERTLLAVASGVGLIGIAINLLLPKLAAIGTAILITFAPVIAMLAIVTAAIAGIIAGIGLIKRLRAGDYAEEGESVGAMLKRGFKDGAKVLTDSLGDAFGDLFAKNETPQQAASSRGQARRGRGGRGGGFGGEWGAGADFGAGLVDDPWDSMWQSTEEFGASYDEMLQRNIDDRAAADAEEVSARQSLNDNLGQQLLALSDRMIGHLGRAGEVIRAGMQGFESGGPWGALIGVIGEIVMGSEAFARQMGHLRRVFDSLMTVFEPAVAAADPLVLLIMMFARLLEKLSPIFQFVGGVMRGLNEALVSVAVIILFIIRGIGSVWNGIVSAISRLFRRIADFEIFGRRPFGSLDGWADSIDRARINMDGLDRTIEELRTGTLPELDDEVADLDDDIEDLGDAANEAAEALLNVPTGYKVAMARFGAISGAGAPAGLATPLGGPASVAGALGAGASLSVETVIVASPDATSLVDDLTAIAETETYQDTGIPIPLDFTLPGSLIG